MKTTVSTAWWTLHRQTWQREGPRMCVLPMYKELENRSPDKFGRHGCLVVADPTFQFVFCIVDNTWTDRWSIARYCKQCRLTMPSRFSVACSGFCWWPFLLWQCFLFSFLLLDMLLLGQLPLGSQGLVLKHMKPCSGKGRAPDLFKERFDSATTFVPLAFKLDMPLRCQNLNTEQDKKRQSLPLFIFCERIPNDTLKPATCRGGRRITKHNKT